MTSNLLKIYNNSEWMGNTWEKAAKYLKQKWWKYIQKLRQLYHIRRILRSLSQYVNLN